MHWYKLRSMYLLWPLPLRIFNVCLLLVLMIFISPLAQSASPIVLNINVGQYSLGMHLDTLEDTEGNWSLEQVRSSRFNKKWVKNEKKVPNFGFTKSAYWLRFQVVHQTLGELPSSAVNINDAGADQITRYPSKWLLELSYAFIDQVDFYFKTMDNQYHVIKSGDQRAYSAREFKYHNFVFPLILYNQSPQVFYIRVQTEGSIELPLTLWSPNSFFQKVEQEQSALGIYYGIMLAMLLYNLFIFLLVKEKTYLFYVLYIICWTISQMIINGYAVQYLWGDVLWWVNRSFSFMSGVMGVWIFVFSMSFLQTEKYVPTLHKILKIVVVTFVLHSVFSLIIPYSISIRISTVLFLSFLPLLIVVGILCWNQGFTAARYYLLAWISLIIGVILFLLKSIDLLPSVFITNYGVQIGSAIEVLLLSFSLADRINQEKKEKLQAEKNRLLAQKNMELALKDKKISEANNRSKTEFFASMSHEFRTPLTSILGYSEAGQENDLSIKEKNDYFKIINRSGKHFLNLINDILDLSKLEVQQLEFENVKIRLLPILEEIGDTFELLAREKGLDFTINNQFPLPKTFSNDPTRLKQILINLCGNAIKFTKTGSVAVKVYSNKEDEKLYFSITDTGIGLKPDQVDKLFKSFSQADISTTRNFGGTGLGLYLSKQLAKKLGGDITVTSEFGKGSTFTVSVAIDSPGHTEWIQALPEQQLIETDILFSGKVLYAEDHEDNRNLVRNIIEKMGADITLACDGREALDLCKNTHFDLIFTDIRMPQIDGVELAEILLKKNPNLAIVAITATLIDSELRKFKQAGFKNILKKPINRHDIYNVMEEYLGKRTTTKDSTKPIRVLLAEDNLNNQEIIKLYLKKIGCETTVVNDGLKAVSYALLEKYDLILMDMRMPNLSGMEAVRILRTRGYNKLIYSLSADDSERAIQECLDAGCDGCISKPIVMNDLQAAIQSLTRRS